MTKHQASMTKQALITNDRMTAAFCSFSHLNLFGHWDLVIGHLKHEQR
jgi:hypothetical protein